MKAMNLIQLLLSAIKQWVLISKDALFDLTGNSFSFNPEVIIQAKALNSIINHHGVTPLPSPAAITEVKRLDVPSISSNCNTLVVSIEQDGIEKTLPDSLFIKLPSPALATRWFLNLIDSWKLETYFFQHVAHTLPIQTPKTYAALTQGTRFCIIQEDLNADSSIKLFTNFDMLSGPSIEQTKQCLDTFAQLHAAHYDMTKDEQIALLPLDYHPFFGEKMEVVSRALINISLSPCIKKHPKAMTEDQINVYKKTINNWDSLSDYWFTGPLSLCHGDSHLGNFYLKGTEMGMLDFQAVHWGNGIRDVQYFLIDSLPANILAEHERDLIQYYVERRGVHGTAIDFETSWQEYRSFTFHTWMTIVVSIGLAAMNEEQDALMAEILMRSVAAIERVDFSQWLNEFLSNR
jgi:hypothetical protein